MASDVLAHYVITSKHINNSLRRQDISSHDIDYVEEVGSSLIWGRISTTCVASMWRNDTKCKYMFMFPLKKIARKGLNGPTPR